MNLKKMYKYLILLIILLSCTEEPDIKMCIDDDILTKKYNIVNGIETNKHFKYVIPLIVMLKDGKINSCSSIIIKKNKLLTAKHCVESFKNIYIDIPLVYISKIEKSKHYDVAVITLNKNLDIKPVEINTTDNICSQLIIVGYQGNKEREYAYVNYSYHYNNKIYTNHDNSYAYSGDSGGALLSCTDKCRLLGIIIEYDDILNQYGDKIFINSSVNILSVLEENIIKNI